MAKGIGIILVVMGHCGGCLPLQALLSSFHMPLFFFLSGLFLFNKEETASAFLRRKAKTLLFPCLVFGFILCTYSTSIDLFRHDSTIPYGLRYVGLFINMRHNPFPGSLWFFPCLFIVEVLMFVVHWCSKKKVLMLLMAMSFVVLGLIIHNTYGKGLPWSIDIALYCVIFTMVGYWSKKTVWKKRPLVTYIFAFIILLTSVYMNYQYSGDTVDLYSCRIGCYPLFFVSAFAGIYLSIGFAKLWVENKILIYFGQNSMLVYSVHFLFLLLVTKTIGMILPSGIISNIVEVSIIFIILVPIINAINAHFKWMTGKF